MEEKYDYGPSLSNSTTHGLIINIHGISLVKPIPPLLNVPSPMSKNKNKSGQIWAKYLGSFPPLLAAKRKGRMHWISFNHLPLVGSRFQTQGSKGFTNKCPICVIIFNIQRLNKVSLETHMIITKVECLCIAQKNNTDGKHFTKNYALNIIRS